MTHRRWRFARSALQPPFSLDVPRLVHQRLLDVDRGQAEALVVLVVHQRYPVAPPAGPVPGRRRQRRVPVVTQPRLERVANEDGELVESACLHLERKEKGERERERERERMFCL